MTTLFEPEPGDKVQVGNELTPWIVGELRDNPYPHANLHRFIDGRAQIKTGVSLSELHVVVPYEGRPEPKERPVVAPTTEGVAV